MARMLACTAVLMLLPLQAYAQESPDLVGRSTGAFVALKMVAVEAVPSTLHGAPKMHPTSTLHAAPTMHATSTMRAAPSLHAASAPSIARPLTFGRRAGTLATTVFRALASQNAIVLGAPPGEMDAFLRAPSSGGDESLFREVKELYDDATTYRTERYDFSVEPLSLKWRLKIRLSPFLMAGSD